MCIKNANNGRWDGGSQFSPDGRYLLAFGHQVWNLAEGKLQFAFTPLNSNCCLFAPDGMSVITVIAADGSTWLVFRDLSTGMELPDRRIPLLTIPSSARIAPVHYLGMPAADRSMYWVNVLSYAQGLPLPRYLNWANHVPMLQRLLEIRMGDVAIAIDAKTGQELVRVPTHLWWVTPDRRYALVHRSNGVFELWDVPARKPVGWLIGAALAWSVILVTPVVAVNFFGRRIRNRTTINVGLNATPPA
jgi:hypothetical protein